MEHTDYFKGEMSYEVEGLMEMNLICGIKFVAVDEIN